MFLLQVIVSQKVETVVGRMKSEKLTSQLKSQAERIQEYNTIHYVAHNNTIENVMAEMV